MSSKAVSEISEIIGHLEEDLIPTGLTVGEQYPEWYESELSKRYARKMRRRARQLLQKMEPDTRSSMLSFFENEEEIRSLIEDVNDQKERLEELGFQETSVEKANSLHDALRSMRKEVVRQSHNTLVEEHPSLGLFVGDGSEATF